MAGSRPIRSASSEFLQFDEETSIKKLLDFSILGRQLKGRHDPLSPTQKLSTVSVSISKDDKDKDGSKDPLTLTLALAAKKDEVKAMEIWKRNVDKFGKKSANKARSIVETPPSKNESLAGSRHHLPLTTKKPSKTKVLSLAKGATVSVSMSVTHSDAGVNTDKVLKKKKKKATSKSKIPVLKKKVKAKDSQVPVQVDSDLKNPDPKDLDLNDPDPKDPDLKNIAPKKLDPKDVDPEGTISSLEQSLFGKKKRTDKKPSKSSLKDEKKVKGASSPSPDLEESPSPIPSYPEDSASEGTTIFDIPEPQLKIQLQPKDKDKEKEERKETVTSTGSKNKKIKKRRPLKAKSKPNQRKSSISNPPGDYNSTNVEDEDEEEDKSQGLSGGQTEECEASVGTSVPKVVPPLLRAASIMDMSQYLTRVQTYFDQLGYHREGEPETGVNIRLSIKHLMSTSRKLIKLGTPIKCLHALILGIHFTNHVQIIERFPIHFKSKVNGREYKHVVLGIYVQGHFGALGISRDQGLQDKATKYPRLSELINDFYQCYHRSGHVLKELKIGSVITHDPHSMEHITWKLGKVSFDLNPDQIEIEIEKIARKLRNQMGSACLRGQQQQLPKTFPPSLQIVRPSPNNVTTKLQQALRSRSIPMAVSHRKGMSSDNDHDHDLINDPANGNVNGNVNGNDQAPKMMTRSRPTLRKKPQKT